MSVRAEKRRPRFCEDDVTGFSAPLVGRRLGRARMPHQRQHGRERPGHGQYGRVQAIGRAGGGRGGGGNGLLARLFAAATAGRHKTALARKLEVQVAPGVAALPAIASVMRRGETLRPL